MESQIGRDVGAAVGQEIPAEATDAIDRAPKTGAPQAWKRTVPLVDTEEIETKQTTAEDTDDLAQRAAALAIPADKKIAVAVVAQKRPAPQKDPATKQAAALALQADVAQLAAELATPIVVATPMIAQKPIVVVAATPAKAEQDLDETSHNLTPVEQEPAQHTDTVTVPADAVEHTDTVEQALTPPPVVVTPVIDPIDDSDATSSNLVAITDETPADTVTRAGVTHPPALPTVSLTTKKPPAAKIAPTPVRPQAEDMDATSPRLGVVPDEDPSEVTAVGRKSKKDPYAGKPRPISPPRPGRSGKAGSGPRDGDADATGRLTGPIGRIKGQAEKGDAVIKSKSGSGPILPVGTVVGWGQRRPEPWKERPVSSARRRAVALAASFTMVAGLVAGGPAALAAMPMDGGAESTNVTAELGGQVENNAVPWAIGGAAVVVVAGVAVGAVAVVRRRREQAGESVAAAEPPEEPVPLERRE